MDTGNTRNYTGIYTAVFKASKVLIPVHFEEQKLGIIISLYDRTFVSHSRQSEPDNDRSFDNRIYAVCSAVVPWSRHMNESIEIN